MKCAWDALLRILPIWMRNEVDKRAEETLLEIRLRTQLPVELVTLNGSTWLKKTVTTDDLRFCINVASKYSPWISTTIRSGYITVEGGHRIGVCGSCGILDSRITGIEIPTSLCIRVARDYSGISKDLHTFPGSLLIIGKPGSGKTTLLRDLVRQISKHRDGSICVVDEKRELFPLHHGEMCFPPGIKTDVISGCTKKQGIEMAIRNMGPETIAIDEITAAEDCNALIEAGWCGVRLIATAHASDMKDLLARPVYRPVINTQLFDALVVLNPDKTWCFERMK